MPWSCHEHKNTKTSLTSAAATTTISDLDYNAFDEEDED